LETFDFKKPASDLAPTPVNLDLDDERFEAGVDGKVLRLPIGGTTFAVNGRTLKRRIDMLRSVYMKHEFDAVQQKLMPRGTTTTHEE
jgi:hypothetical protein